MSAMKRLVEAITDLFELEEGAESPIDWVEVEPYPSLDPIVVHNQRELDELPEDVDGPVILLGDIGSQIIVRRKFKHGVRATPGVFTSVYGRNVVFVSVGCIVSCYEDCKVVMLDEGYKTVHLWDKSSIISQQDARKLVGFEALWVLATEMDE